jgi:antirestriction protein
MTEQRIYVADLAAYNQGHLRGVWLDLDDYADSDDVYEAINEMISSSPAFGAEEWEIHDYEGWGGMRADRYTIEALHQIAEVMEEYGAYPVGTVVYLTDWTPEHGSIEDAVQEIYGGSVESGQDEYDWAWDEMESQGLFHDLPDWIEGRMKQALAVAWFDDLAAGGGITVIRADDGSTHFFRRGM